ncbi:hypothetical protein D3874_18135 [Oleomonas cavernae]|uniref:Uncharacterized protein n=1 Tax=Oleomonas cavernae TaxID=2320859 RepID=A0A418WFB3_9PROT|nr:hypothetical protein [Oleomonas cavernae]RJF88672.1 hypothetical protein D3874_18135 [Oleomonas cavernae]
MLRVAAALGFAAIVTGLLALAMAALPDFGMVMQEAGEAALVGTFAAGFIVWLIGSPAQGAPSPLRGVALGLVAGLVANLTAAIAISLANPASGESTLDPAGIAVIATVGLVKTGPVSLPVAALTGLFYALLLGLLVREWVKRRR